ncbi:MAG TPA: hypothetical protein VNH44_08720 [Micropepsaceae bacterium]|nr:hypothetical protein [Micropepsaceae bacterium]
MALSKTVKRLLQPITRRHGFFYEGFVGTRAGLCVNIVGSHTSMNSRTTSIATDDIRALKIAYANFYMNGAVEIGSGSPAIVSASVEYPSGVFTQIPFVGGQSSGTVASGATLISDYSRVSIPRGATFWIRMFVQNASGVYYNTWDNGAGGDLINSGNGLSDLTMGGSISDDGTFSAPPFAIIGMTSKASVLILGSSVIRGYNDDGTISDFRKGMIAKSFPTDLAFVNLAGDGASGGAWIGSDNGRKALYPYASHAVFELTAVDITNGVSVVAVESVLQSLYQLFGPNVRKTQMTSWARSGSSDGWATAGNQTVETNNSHRVSLNTDLRAGNFPFLNNGIYEVAWAIENSHDDGKWAVDGTANKYTADGTHPTVAGYDRIVSSGAVDTARLHYP